MLEQYINSILTTLLKLDIKILNYQSNALRKR